MNRLKRFLSNLRTSFWFVPTLIVALSIALAVASSQYTSRILRNFMRDRVTQVVLGIFAGIATPSSSFITSLLRSRPRALLPRLPMKP